MDSFWKIVDSTTSQQQARNSCKKRRKSNRELQSKNTKGSSNKCITKLKVEPSQCSAGPGKNDSQAIPRKAKNTKASLQKAEESFS